MPWTTPQPQYDVERLFPFLKGTGRTATRLHPRREANISPLVSKIGGAFAWPSNEPHPVCPIKACPAIPVIQLCQPDFPSIEFPKGKDMLQLLWYPQSYVDWHYNPKIEIYWRQSTNLSNDCVLYPVYENHQDMFIVHECQIEPEQVIEYPYIDLLNDDQRQTIWKWEEEQDDPKPHYQYCLSTCPGTKVGGYPQYSGQDAAVWVSHNAPEYLLTLTDHEWDGGSFTRWRPIEQQFPPRGRTISEEMPNGGSLEYTKYTPEEEKELENWTEERWSLYHFAQSPLGTYLKDPMNVFVNKSVEPWRWQTA